MYRIVTQGEGTMANSTYKNILIISIKMLMLSIKMLMLSIKNVDALL